MASIKMANGNTQARCYDDDIPFLSYRDMAWAEFEELAWQARNHEAYAPFATRGPIGILQDDFLNNLFTEFWSSACTLMWPFRLGSIELMDPEMTGAAAEARG